MKRISDHHIFTILILLSITLGTNTGVFSATITTAGSGNWNSTTNNAPWPGGIVPASTDLVIIASTHSVTVTAAATCAGVTVNSAGILIINASISLIVNGLVSMPRPSTGQSCTIAIGAGTLTCDSVTMNATTSGRNDVISISTGILTINGSITTGTTGCQFTFTGAGTMNVGGSFSNTPSFTAFTGSTVNYTASGAQTLAGVTYYNLTLSGSGVKTTTGVKVNGTLSMEGTATASAAITYGGSATLQYNTATSRTAGAEWITPFAASGVLL